MDHRKYISQKLNIDPMKNMQSKNTICASDLRINKPNFHQTFKKFIKYPFFDYHDVEYQDFIQKLVRHLIPRFFKTNQIIAEELDESLEFYFVMKGTFDFGYEINKKKYYRIKFGPGNVIGAFNLTFNYRSQFTIRAGTTMHCFAY